MAADDDQGPGRESTTPRTSAAGDDRRPGPQERAARVRVALVLSGTALFLATAAVAAIVIAGDRPPSDSPAGTRATAVTSERDRAAPGTGRPPRPSTRPTSAQQGEWAFHHQPLWPFPSQAEAAAWEQLYRADGHQPWHLDAAATATAFATGYLGFTEITDVLSVSQVDREAWVAVGDRNDPHTRTAAAEVHLARYGAGPDAPWEVVGTRDSTFSLTAPRYGAEVTSPVTVGGRITGMDESIRVRVLRQGAPAPLGESCCTPAGGTDTPWSVSVLWRSPGAGVLTIVASTGSHRTAVERFTVTGVTSAGTTS